MPTPNYAITWDDTAERLYETGTKHGVLYPRAVDGTYPTGVPWNGLTGITETPSGAEPNDIYADDMKYISIRSAEEFGGTIEAYTYPEEFAECDGSASVADGVIVGQQTRKPFGMAYTTTIGNDTEGQDYGYKLHLIYGMTASPSEKSYATINDSPEAVTFSWEFTTEAVAIAGHKNSATITIDSTKADPDKLAALEQILYGTPADGQTAAISPRLPLPAEVIDTLD